MTHTLRENMNNAKYRIRRKCVGTNKKKHLRTTVDHNLNEYSQSEYCLTVDKKVNTTIYY